MSSTQPPAPEGWYVDPRDTTVERWWDGSDWTGATRQTAKRKRSDRIYIDIAIIAAGLFALFMGMTNSDLGWVAFVGAGAVVAGLSLLIEDLRRRKR